MLYRIAQKSVSKIIKPWTMVLLFLSFVLAACQNIPFAEKNEPQVQVQTQPVKKQLFEPVREPKHRAIEQSYQPDKKQFDTRIQQTPPVKIENTIADIQPRQLGEQLTGEPIAASFNDLPLPDFINEVFAEQLKLSFTIDPKLQKQNDLVTLRLVEPVTPSELFRIAENTLKAYGVAITQQDNLLLFTVDKSVALGEVPLMLSGEALPQVPSTNRPVYMFVPLKVVKNTMVRGWVNAALAGKKIKIQEDGMRNAIILSGKPDLVNQALAIIKVLDQPLLRGKHAVNIEPAFVKAEELAENLVNILKSEGYEASLKPPLGSIIILPLKGTNQLVVFAPDKTTLRHVEQWARQIDRKQQLGIESGFFSYKFNNVQAEEVVDVLNQVQSGSQADNTGDKEQATAIKGSFVVDRNRNAIIYRGSGQSWVELLPLIKKMDKPSPTVLIEVLLAEVRLNDQENTGVEFLSKANIGSLDIVASTLGKLGLGDTGLSLTFAKAGSTRAIINLFYENKRARVRSRPRLMVKSGQEASIEVGDEIPVRAQQSQSVTSPDAPIVSDIQYRKTGVQLKIKPIVYTSGFVDLEVTQELSQASSTSTSEIDSPTITNRSITTHVTLRDGGSILLGGLISETKADDQQGVPVLADVPLVGNLFKTDGETFDRTELMVLIIPYVINDPHEGEALTETIIQQMHW